MAKATRTAIEEALSAVADLVLNPTESRARLCEFIYRTLEPGNPLGLLQEALEIAPIAEPIEKKIRVEGL